MPTILHLLRGQMSFPVNHLGADVLIYHFSQGGRCPRGQMSGSRSEALYYLCCYNTFFYVVLLDNIFFRKMNF